MMKLIINLEKNLIDIRPGLKKALTIAGSMMGFDMNEDILEEFYFSPIQARAREIFKVKDIEARAFYKWANDYYNRLGKYENKFFDQGLALLNALKELYKISLITDLYEIHARQILKDKGILEEFELVRGRKNTNSNNDKYYILKDLADDLGGNSKDKNLLFLSSDKEDIGLAEELLIGNIYIGNFNKAQEKPIDISKIKDKIRAYEKFSK